MSGTTGGVTIKTLSGRSAAGLCEYRGEYVGNDIPAGGKKTEGYLFAATRHCSHDVETQIQEWKATRVKHGTDGAVRRVKGRYETVDPQTGLHASGKRGTHVKEFSGGRMRKRPVRDGETPTHFYVAPNEIVPFERESEAQHTIYAAGPDLIDRDDIEACERFFAVVKAERDEHYSGLQESMWLERNGESGLVHVHVASNATICEDFTLDGVDYRAGQKVGGQLTKVDNVRARFETYLDAHQQYGFTQSLARVGTPEYEAAQKRDGQLSYWEGRRGQETAQDFMRRASAEVMTETDCTDRADFIEQMKQRGVIVEETGLRRGKAGANHDYAYRLVDGKRAIRGTTLGEVYSYDRVGEQLDLKAAGRELLPYPQRQSAGPAVSNSPTPDEAAELSFAVGDLAREERERQAAEQSQVQAQTPSTTQPGATATAQPHVSAADKLTRLRAQYPEEIAEVEAEIRADLESSGPSTSDQLRAMQEKMVANRLEIRVHRRDFVNNLEDRRVDREEREAAERAREAESHKSEPETSVVDDEPMPPFRSRLRDVRYTGDSEKIAARIKGVARIEEDYRDRATDADLEVRLKQLGVGPSFMRDYSRLLQPEFRGALIKRGNAMFTRSLVFEAGRDITDSLSGISGPQRARAERELSDLNDVRREIEERISVGDYSGADAVVVPGRVGKEIAEKRSRDRIAQRTAREAEQARTETGPSSTADQPGTTAPKPMSEARKRALEAQRENRRANRAQSEREASQSYDGPSM